MIKNFTSYLVLALSLLSFTAFSQPAGDSISLGLPGDNLDLYAVLDLFQKSKTIEDFEKSLNDESTGINNLDLNLDNKVDFIKVVTKQNGNDFTFILQDDINEKEAQDVAVILVSKDKDGKVSMQIVGDEDLYGKDYVIEPKPAAPAVTPNPGYAGTEPAAVSAPAKTNVVVVQSAPIVQYVYSPVYVPYYPPYYYGYYPLYFRPFTVIALSLYYHNNYYYHGGYYGGHHNIVVIHSNTTYNNYHNNRNRSITVNHYNATGNYNSSLRRPKGASATARPSATPSTGKSQVAYAPARPKTTSPTGAAHGSSAAARPLTSPSASQSKGSSSSSRSSASSSSHSSSKSGKSSRSTGGDGRRR